VAKRQKLTKIPQMWFFSMTREERVQHQICNKTKCFEHGIFSNDNFRTWYCGKHMEENYDRPNKS